MVHFIGLSLRNILRNRRRTSITTCTIAAGGMATLLFGGYVNAIVEGAQTGFVRQLGHLQVQKQDYFLLGSGSPADFGVSNYQEVIRAITTDRQLQGALEVVTPTLQMHGIAGNFQAGVSRTVAAVGVIPDDQNRLRAWDDYELLDALPPMALPKDQRPAAVIGQGLARVLQVCSGFDVPDCSRQDGPARQASFQSADMPDDIARLAQSVAADDAGAKERQADAGRPRIEILAATASGAPNVESVPLVAVENQGIKELDDMFVAVPLPLAQRLVYGADPQVTAVIVQLRHTKQLEHASARIRQLIKDHGWDLDVVDYRTLNPAYDQIRALFKSIFGFIAALMGVIVLFSVANTMSMAVMERTVEIGTLRALGLGRRGIYQLFMAEGALIGIVGATSGSILALLVAWVINHSGLRWTPPTMIDSIPLVVHVLGDPMLIVGTFLGLTLLAVLSGLLPARRAARMDVVDALRHV